MINTIKDVAKHDKYNLEDVLFLIDNRENVDLRSKHD